MCPAMENDLASWILEQREKGVCLDTYEIQKKALHFYDLIHPNIDSVISIVITQPPASYLDVSPASNQVESPALHEAPPSASYPDDSLKKITRWCQ